MPSKSLSPISGSLKTKTSVPLLDVGSYAFTVGKVPEYVFPVTNALPLESIAI